MSEESKIQATSRQVSLLKLTDAHHINGLTNIELKPLWAFKNDVSTKSIAF